MAWYSVKHRNIPYFTRTRNHLYKFPQPGVEKGSCTMGHHRKVSVKTKGNGRGASGQVCRNMHRADRAQHNAVRPHLPSRLGYQKKYTQKFFCTCSLV